ncbi:hypothetical protein [Streptomyces sp. ODS28]|uniref:hypothetical protein n=1 Tax=Streptomyces sp. ODS28 TaxID=3136688 RepID=UPI0031F06359
MDSFNAEWDALRAQGEARRDARTRLASAASAAGGNGPGDGDRLATDPAAKEAAAAYLQEQMLPHLRSAGRMGGEPGERSQRGSPGATLHAWKSWQGVEDALRAWGKQVRNLEQRLQGERDALRGAMVLYQTQDGMVRDTFAPGNTPPVPGLPGSGPTGLRPVG